MTRRARWATLASLALISSFAPAVKAQEIQKLVTISTAAKISAVTVCGAAGSAAGFTLDGSVYVWRIPSGELAATWKSAADTSALACSFDGKWVAIGHRDGLVEITDSAGKLARTLAVAHAAVDSLAFAPDGSLLAVSAHEIPVELWDPGTGKRVAELQTDFSGSTSMDFARDTSLFATADADTAVRLYDRSGKLRAKYAGLVLEPFAVRFMPDGKELVVGGADCTLTFLDTSDGHAIRQLPKHPDPIFQTAALPDGHSVLSLHIDAATLANFSVVLWNLETKAHRNLAIEGKNVVGYGEISSHQPALFTADSDSSLTVWVIPD
jgi:WD40 repeat protein